MCSAPQPLAPKVVQAGPGRKEIKAERKEQKQDLKAIRQDMKAQQRDFREQLQAQIDEAAAATQEATMQAVQLMQPPPPPQVQTGSYQVATAQVNPVGAQVTEGFPAARRRPTAGSSLAIIPGTTAASAGTGLNIGV